MRRAKLGCRLGADAHASAPVTVRAISRTHHRGSAIAVRAVAGSDRATWSGAARVIATSGADDGAGLRDLGREEAKGQPPEAMAFIDFFPSE